MKLLALDTATEACSAALVLDGRVAERYAVPGRGHAERLLPMVDELLAEAGIGLAALDGIAFGRGPGAFTGVRIAVAVAQGLALGAGLPVVPVSNLAALARGALDDAAEPVAVPCLDARMGEVYWAEARARPDGGVDLLAEGLAVPAGVAPGATRFVGAGHGWSAYPELVARFGDRAVAVRAELLPRAAWVGRLGALALAAGGGLDPAQAAPVYLRDEVATRSGRTPAA